MTENNSMNMPAIKTEPATVLATMPAPVVALSPKREPSKDK
jgi:hypothetical protein